MDVRPAVDLRTGDRASGVPALPDAESDQLSEAFTTALAPEPSARFINCRAFVDRLTAAVPAVVGQPAEERFTDVPLGSGPEPDSPWDDDDSLETPLVRDGTVETDVALGSEPEPDLPWDDDDSLETPLVRDGNVESVLNLGPELPDDVDARRRAERALGIRALARWPPRCSSEWALASSAAISPPRRCCRRLRRPILRVHRQQRPESSRPRSRRQKVKAGTEVPVPPPPAAAAQKPAAAAPAEAEKNVPRPGRLQIRSTPAGATVQVDGVRRGVTPLTLTGVELGPLAISLSRDGYVGQQRSVTLSTARPLSRSTSGWRPPEPRRRQPSRRQPLQPQTRPPRPVRWAVSLSSLGRLARLSRSTAYHAARRPSRLGGFRPETTR